MRLSKEVGFRLASLADGEGCFIIGRVKQRKSTSYNCQFVVKMRVDDSPFVERFHEATGLGHITTSGPYLKDAHSRNPCVHWIVSNQAGCKRLVEIFDEYPLWSKKARDYVIWREAVKFWTWPNNFVPGTLVTDWAVMAEYKQRLSEVRRYAPPAELEVAA